jgi:hypothetical protein
MPFTDLVKRTRLALSELSNQVGTIPSPELMQLRFNTGAFVPDNEPKPLTSEVDQWVKKECRFIYVLMANSAPEHLARIHDLYSDAKTRERGDRAYARLNSQPSTYIYVGSSASIGRRFREHLGYGARRTYALHLAFWAHDLPMDLELSAARYPPTASEALVGVLEDQLWDSLKPMFGRQGRR